MTLTTFKKVGFMANEKTMETSLTKRLVIFFNSQVHEALGLTKNKNRAGTHLSENPTNVTNID